MSIGSKQWLQNSVWMSHAELPRSIRVSASNVVEWEARGWFLGRKAINGNTHNRKRPYEWLYNHLLYRAARHDKTVDLTYEEFMSFRVIEECHYCGESIDWQKKAMHLDRKDSAEGYSVPNCVVCCGRCNKAKLDHFTYEEWLEIGRLLRVMRKEGRLSCRMISTPDRRPVTTIS